MKTAKLTANTRTAFIVTILIVCVLGYVLVLSKGKQGSTDLTKNTPSTTNPTQVPYKMRTVKPTLTEATTIPGWRKYTDPNKKYSFEVPADWVVEVEEDSSRNKPFEIRRVIAKYEQDNKEYQFYFPQGGSGVDSDNAIIKQMTFAGTDYEIRTFHKDRIPFLISAIPLNEKLARLYNHIEIELPNTNTDYYRNTFYQILSTFKFAN